MTGVWIGRVGDMREVRSPRDPMPVDHSPAASSRRLLSGAVVTQLPPATRRTWSWDLTWATPDQLAYLTELEAGLHGREYYWYNPVALESNMLSAAASMPGTEPDHGWSASSGSTITVVSPGLVELDGVAAIAGRIATLGGLDAAMVAIPGPGATYTWSLENVDASESVDLNAVAVDADGGVVHGFGGPVTVGPGQRGVITASVAAASAAQLGMVVDSSAPCLVSRPQITQTDGAIDWVPGVGIPRVVITGVSEVYRMAVAGLPARSDWSASLIEVG